MFPQSFIDKTLELIIDRGPMPFHDPGGRQKEAHPLTNSHRDALRQLQRQGAVKIDYEGDELIVSYAGPPVPDKMYAALRALPDRAIYVVPTEKRRQMARDYIRNARESGLWTGARVHVALLPGTTAKIGDDIFEVAEGPKFMNTLMSYHRPVVLDHRCIRSAASTIALRAYHEGLPDADNPYRREEAGRRESFWRFGDPARFHRPPPASGRRGGREVYRALRRAARGTRRGVPITPGMA